MDEQVSEKRDVKINLFSRYLSFLVVFILAIIVGFYYFVVSIQKPPANFPIDTPVTISVGSTVRDVAKILKENDLVKSELAFFAYFTLFHDQTSLKASNYVFAEALSLPELAYRLTQGNYGEGLIRFTHIEGERVEKIAEQAEKVLSDFNKEKFLVLAKPFEGKLFPETYMIPDDYTEEELFDLLTKTFAEKIAPYEEEITNHNLSLDEIIILASILEREANTPESKKIVSGILQNRLSIDMPLQVDASIEYVLDKPLSELQPEDLKIDSPYNTYLNIGLPPTPIGNPGLVAIEAILRPTKTEYVFYITGNDGNFYYAKDFDEHRQNIAKYLR